MMFKVNFIGSNVLLFIANKEGCTMILQFPGHKLVPISLADRKERIM